MTSHNTKDTQYKVYYQILKTLTEEQRANIRIETIRINTVDLPTGSISPSETKTIVIELENKNDTPVTIDLGVQGGLIGREIILEEGNSIKVIEGTRTIQKVESEDYNEKLWKHKDAITKVVFQNQKQSVGTVSYSYDISDTSDGSVMAYLVRNNDSSTYTAYIQAEDRIYTNVSASLLAVLIFFITCHCFLASSVESCVITLLFATFGDIMFFMN